MRRWLELLLVVVTVAVAGWFFNRSQQPLPAVSATALSPNSERFSIQGYSLDLPQDINGTAILEVDSQGEVSRGRSKMLLRSGTVILSAGDSRQRVVEVLGYPDGFNHDNSMWGYWTRNLPDKQMGILIHINSSLSTFRWGVQKPTDKITEIELARHWSTLAGELMHNKPACP